MGYIFRLSTLVFVISILAPFCKAQEGKVSNVRIKELGGVVGAGYGMDTFNLPQGNYTPIFLIGRISIDFRNKNAIKSNKGEYAIFFEPQFNPVLLRNTHFTVNEFEYGLNIGFQYMYPITEKLYISTFISTGPHYFSATTERQAPGFLFSDNFGLGVYQYVYKNLAVHCGFRLRHMSNAQTRLPNSGINTFNFMVGFSKLLRK